MSDWNGVFEGLSYRVEGLLPGKAIGGLLGTFSTIYNHSLHVEI